MPNETASQAVKPKQPKQEGRVSLALEKQKQLLEEMADEIGISQTELIRQALKAYRVLHKHNKNGAVTLVGADGKELVILL